jgi:hypothetical protein
MKYNSIESLSNATLINMQSIGHPFFAKSSKRDRDLANE